MPLSIPTQFHEPAARWGKMFVLSTIVGILAGLAAAALQYSLLFGIEHGIGRFMQFDEIRIFQFRWPVLLLPAAGGLLTGLVIHWFCRHERLHGTNQLITAFHHRGGVLPLADPAIKAGGAVTIISLGGSAGPEGPIAALGAGIGSSVGRLLKLSTRERRILLIAGCGGGIGAIFQCPLGGALFATSVLYREPEFEANAIVPAFFASVISYSTYLHSGLGHRLLTGADQLMFTSALELGPYALLGVLCGALSIFFFFCMQLVERAVTLQMPLPRWLSAAIGGLMVGAIACMLPPVIDGHYATIQKTLDGTLAGLPLEGSSRWFGWALFFGLVAVVKCVATALTVGSGGAGGVLGPSVFAGGSLGAALGCALEGLFPDLFPPQMRLAMIPVAIGGVLAATMRTPLAAIVMTTEMTGSYGLMVPLMLVCVTSYVVGRQWSLNTAQVRSISESPAHVGDALVHMLESWRVEDLMERHWPYTLAPTATLGEMVTMIPTGSRPVFSVVENGRLVGVISVADIIRVISDPYISDIVIAADIMTTRLTVVQKNQNLYEVLETFRSTNHEVLPVVSGDGEYEGMLSRMAIHRAARKRLDQMRAYLQEEHASLAAFDQDEQLHKLLIGVAGPREDTIQRMPVPPDAVGKSLREADFRQRYAAQVIAIQSPDGRLHCPPDIDKPLRADQSLLVAPIAEAQKSSITTIS